ncbi:microtubule-associated protein EB1 [Heterostelium album PN500]|uniref:Microtubule-associated protein EB1 n=1 Tax=Heterostelium pallidum (strain ATCC 26659 / Pp 5 / PN500) TaxID=670386 RepID=D3BDZ0_HETP5|nr:microtubule-associated protein EB1 [Heterostelium album PN500]EFA80121.1 microtubule-associated protein EB1 [Heterostelium album PN500]|eukprot:XP_020432241.1 microtubule-associated protein EB1 [Heterostelium album PN500]
MEGGGRNEILNWLNDTLQLKYTKIEQTATGAAHCQLMDVLFPGKLPLSKVNYNAKYDYEYIKNFNLLQETFVKLGVEKYQGAMDVDRMVTGRPQANLDFCQWMKKFFDLHYNGEPYNALERRVMARCNYEGDKPLLAALGPNAPKAPLKTGTTTAGAATSKSAAAKPVAAAAKPTTSTSLKPTATSVKPTETKPTTTTTTKPTTNKPTVFKPTPLAKPTATATTTAAAVPTSSPAVVPQTTVTTVVETVKVVDPTLLKELEEKREETEKLKEEIANLKITIEDIEKDRDFFYEKLRAVELYCQANETHEGASEIIKHILGVLYKTDETAADEEQPQEEEEQPAEEEIIEEEEEIIEEEPIADEDNLNYDDEPLLDDEPEEF